jgi:O-antigen ligase
MGGMPAIQDLVVAEPRDPVGPNGRRTLIATGATLILLLIFVTFTVFVQESWPVESFQIGVYGLTAAYLLFGIGRDHENLARGISQWLVYLIPVWGVIQILAHTTASTIETREAVLRWGALAAVFFLSQAVAPTSAARDVVLLAFMCFAAGMAVLCLTQLFTSHGRVFWIFPTEYPTVYATFLSPNNYAQFVEVSLPIALWWALRDGWRSWGYALVAGVLYASVIGSASRAGAILCTAELLAMLAIGFYLHKRQMPGNLIRSTSMTLLVVPLLAAIFTFVVGWQRIWQRFQEVDPYMVRREFILSAIDMAKHRPLMGYGLGTFPEVYQQHAIKDFPFYANHAHNDWAEFAADGGIPFLLLVLIPFAAAVPAAIRHPWGFGLIAVMLHACVDYPFPRPAVSGWMFAMLALLYMARTPDQSKREPSGSPSPDHSRQVLEFKR